MEPNEAAVFRQRMDQLANPTTSDTIVSDRARSRENRKFIQRFEEWRDEISKGTNDVSFSPDAYSTNRYVF